MWDKIGDEINETILLEEPKQSESPNPKPIRTSSKTRNRNNNAPLTKHEVEQLLSQVDNLKDYTLLLYGFYSGLRVGELSGLGFRAEAFVMQNQEAMKNTRSKPKGNKVHHLTLGTDDMSWLCLPSLTNILGAYARFLPTQMKD